MNSNQLYKVVSEWLRANVEGEDEVVGCTTVVSMAICEVDTDIEREVAKYGWAEDETSGYHYRIEGATHLVRFLAVCDADLVDGDNCYFKIEDGQFVLINEPDRPAFCGGYLDEGMAWVAERSLRHATDIGE
jgi:hypothetical protein